MELLNLSPPRSNSWKLTKYLEEDSGICLKMAPDVGEEEGPAVREDDEIPSRDDKGTPVTCDELRLQSSYSDDQEEGEISETEEEVGEDIKPEKEPLDLNLNLEAGDTETESFSLKKMASLDDNGNDVVGRPSKGRDELFKRDVNDDVIPWLREKPTYLASPNSSYPPNLYNLAWAQAVQGGPGFKLVKSPSDKEEGDDDQAAEGLQSFDDAKCNDEEDEMMMEWQVEGGSDAIEMSVSIPEGYDMRERLYDRRRMRSAMWNGNGKERKWPEVEEDLQVRRRFGRDESRTVVISRRDIRSSSSSRRRDGKLISSSSSRREDLEVGDVERERRNERDRVWEGEKQRARDRERERERADRKLSSSLVHRPTSSDDDDSFHSCDGPSASKRGKQFQSDDNAAAAAPSPEVREEGEIEEGEIELNPTTHAPSSRSPSRDKSEDLQADNTHSEERILRNGNSKKSSLSSRLSFQSRPSHSRSLSRDSFVRLQDDDLRHRLSRDAEREKLQGEHRIREERRERIAQVGSLLKSVTVKDAQKSFISTCRRLDHAMQLLEDLGRQRSSSNVNQSDGLPRDVPKLATKVFQGLRAVYAVWNTARGREQERDKDTFPRLVELVNGSYLKLFTPKQARELKDFMEQTMKASRRSGIEGGVQASIKPIQPSQDSDTRPHRKSSDDMTTSTSLTRKSSGAAVAMEIPENKSSSENPAESKHKIDEAAIAAAAQAYAQSSAAAFANITHGSTGQPANNYLNADQGHWGWNGMNVMNAYEQSMSPGLPPGYSGRSHSAKDSGVQGQANGHGSFHISAPNSLNHAYNEWMPTAMENKQKMASNSHYNVEWVEHKNKTVEIKNKNVLQNTRTPYRHGYLEEDWEAMSPPHANPSVYTSAVRKTVKADERGFPLSSTESAIVNIPHIKVSNFRLPSPTPDEEDDNNNKEVEISLPLPPPPPPVLTELTSLRQKPLLPLPKPLSAVPLTARPFYTTLNTHVDETGRVHYASVPMGMAMPVDQDQALNFEQPKSHQGSGSVLASFRSRDPRRQQLRNEYMEVNDYPQHPNGQLKYPWPTSTQSGPFVTSRKREGEGYSHEIDTSKRLKMAGSNSGLLGSEPSAAGLAIGGWLEDHTTLSSSQENSDIQPMDIDTESPINVERKQGTDLDSAGAVIRSTDVPRDNSLSEVAGLRPSSKTLENEVSDSISVRTLKLEEQADDGGKPRMRPRDPRRALLELSVQKENGISQIDPVHEPGAVAQPRKRSPSPSNLHPTPQSQLSANLGYTQSPLEGPSNLNGVNPSSAAEDMNINEKSRERIKSGDMDSVKQSTVIAGEINPGSDADGLESEDPLSRKPQLGPNHWGGNELHPDLEQLLGNLDDAERLAIQSERKRRMEEQDRMFSAGKLCLVLDLDHTLLNSAKFVEIEPEWETRLRAAENLERSRASKEGNTKRELYRFSHMGMWTKLRPGIWNFLAKASELYELHVYTMGNKAYATEMAKLLDPTGTLFAERVISKGDGGDVVDSDDKLPKSKDLDGVLGMESAVVIIDDSARVWPHHRENLIVVERYMYFPCSRRQFGLPGPSLLEVGHDERPADGMLASTLAVIDRIHKRFFSNKRLREVDVRAILAAEQRQVLAGCCVLFSRIFPVGEANPHVHPLWRMAEQFGATCCLNINDKVTHVVAISLGTDKVNWASATGRPVVRPTWLEASALLYRRANEQDFPVPP